MGRKILLVTTDQQRYDTLGCNGGTLARTPVDRRARRRRSPLRARPSAVGRVHAVAIDDHHRPAPEHARRVDERRRAAGRRAVGGRGAARRRLSHGLDRQAALRAVPRSVRPVHREPLRPTRGMAGRCTAGSSTSRRRRTAPHGPLHYARWLADNHPEAVGDVLPGARRRPGGQRRRRWRDRRTTGPRQRHPARVVPHRLGGRPHDRRGSTRSTPTTTGSAG